MSLKEKNEQKQKPNIVFPAAAAAACWFSTCKIILNLFHDQPLPWIILSYQVINSVDLRKVCFGHVQAGGTGCRQRREIVLELHAKNEFEHLLRFLLLLGQTEEHHFLWTKCRR